VTTSTWRDLADELTPAQIAEMEKWESKFPDEQQGLLTEARQYAADNLVDAVMFPHITKPLDAHEVYGWTERAGQWSREFVGTTREPANGFAVALTGFQCGDGRVERYGRLYGPDRDRFTSDDLRAAGAALIEAADELDRLNR
jgi:hypothetical protein